MESSRSGSTTSKEPPSNRCGRRAAAVGLLEVLGAAGVVLPAALNSAPVLTPIAALGLAAMMIGAGVTHLRLHETGRVLAPVALFLLALLVAFLRLAPHTF